MHNNTLWSNSHAFSLIICKVYTKRENAGVGFRVPADPLDSNTGVRTEISPSTYLHLTASL